MVGTLNRVMIVELRGPATLVALMLALAFLLFGAGVHRVQAVGLALAADLVPLSDQPKVVGLMYVMLLVGMIISAFVFGALLENYTPGRLIEVIQGVCRGDHRAQ